MDQSQNEFYENYQCHRLFELATPNLYRENSFRILELPVDVSMRAIDRQRNKLRMMQQVGISAGRRNGGFMPLESVPAENEVELAMQRLRDPESRFLDEVFWFWPHNTDSSNDESLKSLAANRRNDAQSLWLKAENMSSESKISTHNLAVFYHVIALDIEQMAVAKNLDGKLLATCQSCWTRAYKRWQILMKDEGFWSHLSTRIRQLDDPRLTTGLGRRIRNSFPMTLLLINARLAVQAAQRRKAAEVRRHLQLIENSGFNGDTRNAALRESLAHLREQIKMMCSFAAEKSNADPQHADKQAWSLLKGAKPLLAVIDLILPKNDFMRDGAHDEVANQVIICACTHSSKTSDWTASLKIHEAVLPVAVSESTITQIKQNLEIIKQNCKYCTCFFCEKGAPKEDAAFEVAMYGDVQNHWEYGGTRITWQHIKLKVPRCAKCRSIHNVRLAKQWLFGALGALSGFLVAAIWGVLLRLINDDLSGLAGFIIFVGIIAGAVFGAVFGSRHGGDVKSPGRKNEFITIKEYINKGWQFGDKPPNVQ